MIKQIDFKKELDGKSIEIFELKNSNGLQIFITNYGLKVVSILVPDKKGVVDDIVLGFSTIEEYFTKNEHYYGAIIGRYGNRIANASFKIDGKEFQLERNDGDNNLHGGTAGFNNVIWDVVSKNKDTIIFNRLSPEGECGFPGNLDVTVTYSLNENNEFAIDYAATTDKATIVNLTHHSYFNLAGAGHGNVENHLLKINANQYIPVNTSLIPDGNFRQVANTAFDFRKLKRIGLDIGQQDPQLLQTGGYDHTFILEKNNSTDQIKLAATVIDPISCRKMEVFTNEPGIQFYSCNYPTHQVIGKDDRLYKHRGAFCLETQHYPDSPNRPDFPSTQLNPEDVYSSTCIYKFSIANSKEI